MHERTLHVVFSPSGAGTLKVALSKAGRNDEVVSLYDNLSFGPVEYANLQERKAWIEENLSLSGYEEVIDGSKYFWDKALSNGRRKVLWTSRRSAMEYCGFLECLWRLGGEPCSVIDLTEVKIKYRKENGEIGPPVLAICLPVLSEHNILNNGLLDIAEPLGAESKARYQAVWKKLREENAAFRVVNPEGIASAPITHFDSQVLSCVTSEWQKSARIVGEVMGNEDRYYIQTGDLTYFARLQKLVEVGLVESRGDMSKMRGSEVRLPPASKAAAL